MRFLIMIVFKRVSKTYPGGYVALNKLDFHLEKGEMAFLTGSSGSGKSTLLKLIAYLDVVCAGEILVNGVNLSSMKKKDLASYRANLGIIFQSPHILNQRTAFDNVALSLEVYNIGAQIVDKRVLAALDMVGLLNKAQMLAMHLSGGEQQRLGIARALVHRPNILLADEPTGNLDPALSVDMMKLFAQFNQAGVSVLIATHDLALIARMKHRIIVLKGGRICNG